MKEIKISKTGYLEGLRCARLFWLRTNQPELATPVDAQTAYLFETGHLVGEYARKLFPQGVLVGGKQYRAFSRLLADTEMVIQSGSPCLFEAAFAAGPLRCRCDVLHRSPGSPWDLAEVKMCTTVKLIHIDDIAFQTHCIQCSGHEVGRKFLIHVSRDYVRCGDINPYGLFAAQELTEEVNAEVKSVPRKVAAFIDWAEKPEPPRSILGTKCNSPGKCAYYEYCHGDLPPTSVYQLPYGGKMIPLLLERGISRLEEIPPNVLLSERQGALVKSAKSGEPVINVVAIRAFLKRVRFPVCYLDFETIAPAIPPWDDTFSYEKIPFQFSLHYQEKKNDVLKHFEFLPESPEDPRRRLCDELVEILCATDGTILAWNASFEKSVLERMAALFQDKSAKIHGIISRIVDLIVPFRSGAYSDFRFEGSASLKKVLPVLVPSLSYDCLSIKRGDDASLQFQMFAEGKMSNSEWSAIRLDLLTYCGLDTLAMVEILAALYGALKGGKK